MRYIKKHLMCLRPRTLCSAWKVQPGCSEAGSASTEQPLKRPRAPWGMNLRRGEGFSVLECVGGSRFWVGIFGLGGCPSHKDVLGQGGSDLCPYEISPLGKIPLPNSWKRKRPADLRVKSLLETGVWWEQPPLALASGFPQWFLRS